MKNDPANRSSFDICKLLLLLLLLEVVNGLGTGWVERKAEEGPKSARATNAWNLETDAILRMIL